MRKYQWDNISEYRTQLMGLAIIMVITVHSIDYRFSAWSMPLRRVFCEGGTGVDFFLFLSVVGLFYAMSKKPTLIDFYKRRLLRIIPTYFPIAIVAYGIYGAIFKHNTFIEYLSDVFLISFWTGRHTTLTWYISFILVLYLVYPLLYKMVQSKHSYVYGIILIVITTTFQVVMLENYTDLYEQNRMAYSRIFICIVSVYVAKWIFEKKQFNALSIFVMYAIWGVFRVYFAIFIRTEVNRLFLSRIVNVLFVIATCMLYSIVVDKIPNWIRRCLQFLGGITLELYLIHNFLAYFYRKSPALMAICDSVWIYYLGIIPLSILMAFAYQKLIKRITKVFAK